MLNVEHHNQRINEHIALIRQFRSLGRKILSYHAPCCGMLLDGMAASKGDTWHTGATCPQCGRAYFKVTTEDTIHATLTQANWGIA